MKSTYVICLVLMNLPLLLLSQSRIEKSGNPAFVLHNTTALNTNTASSMYFKTGSYFGGGIGVVGNSASNARLAIYTQTTADQNNLLERMTITSGGLVGIGQTNPTSVLHVKAAGIGFTQESSTGEAKVGFYTATSSAYVQTHNNIPLYFATNNGSAQMTLTTTGRFGINTSAPVSRFEVKGKTKITQMAGEDSAIEVAGAIKVSGTAPAAFQVTAGNNEPIYITINHPAANGKPDAMLFVTHCSESGNYLRGLYSVKYDPNIQRWQIVALGAMLQNLLTFNVQACSGACVENLGIPDSLLHNFQPGTKFNVMVIER